jgi:hypothetical protein
LKILTDFLTNHVDEFQSTDYVLHLEVENVLDVITCVQANNRCDTNGVEVFVETTAVMVDYIGENVGVLTCVHEMCNKYVGPTSVVCSAGHSGPFVQKHKLLLKLSPDLEAQECLSADVQLHDDVALKLFNSTTGAQIAAMSDDEFAVFYGQYFDRQYKFTLKVTGANSRFPKITATSVVAC